MMVIKDQSINQNGYILITFITLGAVLCSLALGVITTAETVQAFEKAQHRCERQSVKIQLKQAKLLRSLLMLNPRALKLRKQRKQAEKALRIALRSKIPHAIAAAETYLIFVKGLQLAHRMKQEKVLLKSAAAWSKYRSEHSLLQRQGARQIAASHPRRLPMRQEGQKTGSPTYFPAEHFQSREMNSLRWTQVHKSKGAFLKVITGKEQILIHIACQATLRKQGRKWVPGIYTNRLSWHGGTIPQPISKTA